ncbi:MAG: hypothetical protein HF976_13940 [ANME-2 cluster archaeon]|nr:hypothetical protein [ANME-2 cluster archaeon]MBC2702478.1 hypothetical protein [ANME-2 cluster archaeon]MBC2707944.1 hypothetical protein [ANME-2 cluster archaeon]MBC2747025.1 hypothetical protein [ANME-2 cluster archaeon]
MNVVRSVGSNPVQSNLVISVAAALMYITGKAHNITSTITPSITLMEDPSRFVPDLLEFVPQPPEKGRMLLDRGEEAEVGFRVEYGVIPWDFFWGLVETLHQNFNQNDDFSGLSGTMSYGFYDAYIYTQAAFAAFSHNGCRGLAVRQFKNICGTVIPAFTAAHARAMTYFDGNAVCLAFHSGHWFLPPIET